MNDAPDPLLHTALARSQSTMNAEQLARAFHMRMRGNTWRDIAAKVGLNERQIAAAVRCYCDILESHFDDDVQDNAPDET